MKHTILLLLFFSSLVLGCGSRSSEERPSRASDPGGSAEAIAPSESNACHADRDCEVVPQTTCGNCGAAAPGNARAVNKRAHAAGELTWEPEPNCPNGGCSCDDCFAETPASLFADCHQGQCRLTETDRTPFNGCATEADCTITPRACGDCAGSSGWVAVARDREADFAAYLCEGDELEPPCTPSPPPVLPVACQAGHCQIARQ